VLTSRPGSCCDCTNQVGLSGELDNRGMVCQLLTVCSSPTHSMVTGNKGETGDKARLQRARGYIPGESLHKQNSSEGVHTTA
jgi:hypothetical protein